MAGDHDGDALAGELDQEAAHLLDTGRVQAVGGLIENEQLGLSGQRQRDAEALFHAHGVGAHQAVLVLGQAHQCQGAADLLVAQSLHLRRDPHVLRAREVAVAGWVLDHGAGARHDLGACGRGEGSPEHADLPAGGRQQSQQHLHRGRLARAVGAEEAVDAPAWHHEVQALDNGALAEGLGEVAGQDDGVVGRRGERGSRLRVGSRLGGCDAGGDDAGCCIRAGLGRVDRLGERGGCGLESLGGRWCRSAGGCHRRL